MSSSKQLLQCSKCPKYMLRKSLYSHLRVVHKCDSDEVDALKAEFSKQSAMNIPSEQKPVICPLCEERFTTHEHLAHHCEDTHRDESDDEPQDYTVFSLTFNSKEDFDVWIEEQQQRTLTSFVRRTSTEAGTHFDLRCNRAGKYVRRTESRATHTKKDVSHCSCFIIGHIDENGKVNVKGCLGHVGHTIEPALLRLTYAQQSFLGSLLEEFSNDYIIKRLRKDFSPEKSKLYYVTHTDLWAVTNRLGLRPGYRHADDMQSLRIREEEHNPEDGIRLLEMPQDPSGKGFRMVIITPQQAQWLRDFSPRGISVDDTHNATKYNLKLATVTVLNERDTGFPAAFLLSGTMTTADVEAMFQEILKLELNFNPKIIKTDEAPCFYNGFKAVFPQSSAKLHYCRWHIDRTWQRSANKLVEPRVRSHVKKMLRDLLVIADLPSFEEHFASILAFLQLEGQTEMRDYLRKNYLGRTPTWASFANEGAVMATTMISERWHLRLKSEFLHRNANSRADSLVELLIRAVKELSESDRVKARRRLANASYRVQKTTACHRDAMKRYRYCQQYIKRLDDENWEIQEGAQGVFGVQLRGTCDCRGSLEENVHCPPCAVCPYSWSCTCADKRAGISCKHIHAVALYALDEAPTSSPQQRSKKQLVPHEVHIEDLPTTSGLRTDDSGMLEAAQASQERREQRQQLRSSITMNVSVLQRNVNALVNEDTDDSMQKLRQIDEMVRDVSMIGLTPSRGIAIRPELTKQGAKPKLAKVEMQTRKQSRVLRPSQSAEILSGNYQD